MAESVTFVWDKGQIAPLLNRGLEKAVASALSKSGSRAIRTVRTASSRAIRFRKRIKLRTVNRALSLSYPTSKAISGLIWRMDVSQWPSPVADFNPRQTAQGVTVAINAGKRVLIKSAFLATMKSGHFGVWMRAGKSSHPIHELYTTRVADIFSDAGMVPAVFAQAAKTFGGEFDRLFPLEVARLTK